MTTIRLEASELERFLEAAPRKVFAARRSAIQTTLTFAERELKNRLLAATGLPSTVFRKIRVRKRVNSTGGNVWLGYNPVKAGYAGKLRQEDGGAWAGPYYFAGGIVATMRSGHSSIFKRGIGKRLGRQTLIEQTVELPQADSIAAQVEILARVELQRRYNEKLQALLNR
jgi:hypothetical protein